MTIAHTMAPSLEWANTELPDRTLKSTKAKLFEEIGELVSTDFEDEKEYADVLIVLFDLAWQHGIDLDRAVYQKMSINEAREWSRDDNGIYQHD